jgi:hypothetical protein
MMRSRCNGATCARAALWLTVACGDSRPAIGTPGQAGTGSGESIDGTRGMHIEPEPVTSATTPSSGPPVAGSDAPFVLETRLIARRMQHGQPITLDEIHNGDIVLDGDRLQVSVRTSKDGYLYLAFCSQQARDPRYRGLIVFPDEGSGIPMVANQSTLAPANAAIVIDKQPGPEPLYLILSRDELSRAGLADVLAAARQGRETTDCGPFQAAVAGSRKGNGRPRQASAAPPPPNPGPGKPVVVIQRGAYVVFGSAQSGDKADPDRIVVLRYDLEHRH